MAPAVALTKQQAEVFMKRLCRKLKNPAFSIRVQNETMLQKHYIEVTTAGPKKWNVAYFDLVDLTIEATSSNITPVKTVILFEDPDLIFKLNDYLVKLAETSLVKKLSQV